MTIATRMIFWAAAPLMLKENATLYNPNTGVARKGDLFAYKDMVIFCAREDAIKRPMELGEHAYIYSDTSACFEKNGVYVICQDQYNVGANKHLGDMLKLAHVCQLDHVEA